MKQPLSLKGRALAILSRREISRQALLRKLAPYSQDEDELSALLNELAQNHWQSDARYAEAYIHSKSPKQGTLRLKQALSVQGIDSEIVQEYLPDLATERNNAINVLQKKFKQPAQDYQEKQKQVRFLLYRGFDIDTAQYALKNAWRSEV